VKTEKVELTLLCGVSAVSFARSWLAGGFAIFGDLRPEEKPVKLPGDHDLQ
jgi:hypothetical protein